MGSGFVAVRSWGKWRRWLSKSWEWLALNKWSWFAVAAVAVLIVFLVSSSTFDRTSTDWRMNVAAGTLGFLLDILLFGVIISLLEQWSERRRMIREYHDQLDDFRFWAGEEGVLRKVGIIRRLKAKKADLPSLNDMCLSSARLSGFDLSGIDLLGADLSKANMSEAVLSGSCLELSNLSGTILARANLRGANLCSANLTNAMLRGCDLSHSNLSGADLAQANIREAVMRDAEGLDLQQVMEAQHWELAILPDFIERELRRDGWTQVRSVGGTMVWARQ